MTRYNWRRAGATAFISAVIAITPGFVAAAAFFQSIDDLPLAPGLTELVDQGVAFESPAGRIVTAVAQSGEDGKAVVSDVEAFYRKALPPLGWSALSARIYTREGERLTFRFEQAGKLTILRVRLVPGGAK